MSSDVIERLPAEWDARALAVQVAAAQAYERLLHLAKTRSSGQIQVIVRFLASTCPRRMGGFSAFDLRAVDVEISDDILICIDAIRWAQADLWTLVPRGAERLDDVCEDWGV